MNLVYALDPFQPYGKNFFPEASGLELTLLYITLAGANSLINEIQKKVLTMLNA